MRRTLILATVIVLVMGAGIAIALVGDDGVIYACADDKDGTLRLVDGPDGCDKKEALVFWNQRGIQGDPGDDGTDGTDGADGNLALANQVCAEEGESVIGFNDAGDIICQIGGATTTTTTTTTEPPTVSDEVCNGIDDDLNGVIDDNLTDYPDDGQAATEASCVSGVWVFTIVEGFCLIDGVSYEDGMVNPADSALVCDSDLDNTDWSPATGTEVCDGIDNDGNLLVDDGLGPYCIGGLRAVNTDGDSSCLLGFVDFDFDPANGCEFIPSPEVCDGLDNNGDFMVDELWPIGEPCQAGVQGGWYQCSADGTTAECVPTG